MGTMTPQELLRLYTLEKITDQQALGHMLQNLVRMQAELEALSETRFDVERLKAFTGMEPEDKPKKKEKREDRDKTSEV
jgi:hypothetical protein